MGFRAPMIYHGPRERGKDIITFDYDRLGNRQYFAVVAKTTSLNGSVSSSNSLREVVYQIEQCFNVPYEDLFGMTRITMDQVWVVTSGMIVSGAEESIFSQLQKTNLSKLVRFISGENLIQLIDEHYPTYWDESVESIDMVKEHKHRLIKFCRELLLAHGGDPSDIEATINQVIHSSFPPNVISSRDRALTRVSPYSVEFDSIAPNYAHEFYSGHCGIIKSMFFKAKDDIYHAMFDVCEIIEHYEEVIKKTDPREIINLFYRSLGNDYPFHRAGFGHASDAWSDIQGLEGGLNDIDDLIENLSKIGKLEWATSLVDSVPKLENEVKAFLAYLEKDTFSLHWKIESEGESGRLRLLYENEDPITEDMFSTEHQKEIEYSRWPRSRFRTITPQDIFEQAQAKIRDRLDKMLVAHGVIDEEDIWECLQ